MAISKAKFEEYKGQPVAILCMRYWYRGILSEVGDGYVVLTDAKAVEQTGSASAATTDTEDAIPSPVVINTDSTEILCQPTWAFAGHDTL